MSVSETWASTPLTDQPSTPRIDNDQDMDLILVSVDSGKRGGRSRSMSIPAPAFSKTALQVVTHSRQTGSWGSVLYLLGQLKCIEIKSVTPNPG